MTHLKELYCDLMIESLTATLEIYILELKLWKKKTSNNNNSTSKINTYGCTSLHTPVIKSTGML